MLCSIKENRVCRFRPNPLNTQKLGTEHQEITRKKLLNILLPVMAGVKIAQKILKPGGLQIIITRRTDIVSQNRLEPVDVVTSVFGLGSIVWFTWLGIHLVRSTRAQTSSAR